MFNGLANVGLSLAITTTTRERTMKTKKVSSNTLLKIIFEAYKNDPEGLLSDLENTVDSEESLADFAQSAVECLEMDEEDEKEVEFDEDLKKVPALLQTSLI